MKRLHWVLVLGLSVLVLGAGPLVAADAPRTLEWDDLLPPEDPLQSPFDGLTDEQLGDLESLLGIRDLERQGLVSPVDETAEEAIETRHRLKSQGVDADAILAKYEALEREVARRGKLAVAGLDGKEVRLPGYALPLEHKGTAVKEMLLVPYLGACIHVPPPPANQTVYVTLAEPYTVGELYEPVWITGRMSVKPTNKSLTYVDGSAGVDAAYTLQGIKVELYKE
jgi:hypothetical protein